MMSIKRTLEVSATPAVSELAECFWDMDGDEQAEFFNTLSLISGGRMPFQLQAVTDSGVLNREGRYIMSLIGDYSEPAGE